MKNLLFQNRRSQTSRNGHFTTRNSSYLVQHWPSACHTPVQVRAGWTCLDRDGFSNQRDFGSTCWLLRSPAGMPKDYSQDGGRRACGSQMTRALPAGGFANIPGHGGHHRSKLMPHRDFSDATRPRSRHPALTEETAAPGL
jgi:hypothetical protein